MTFIPYEEFVYNKSYTYYFCVRTTGDIRYFDGCFLNKKRLQIPKRSSEAVIAKGDTTQWPKEK